MFNHQHTVSQTSIGKFPKQVASLFAYPLFRSSLFLVGGAVRDSLLGKKPDDYDFVCFLSKEQLLNFFPSAKASGQGNKMSYLVEHEGYSFDICLLSKNNIAVATMAQMKKKIPADMLGGLYMNAFGRDFTMNAMYYNPSSGLIDFFSGMKDVQDKTISVIGKQAKVFLLYPLRMLRAMRQAKQLNFSLSDEYLEVFQKNASLLHQVSVDRLQKEYDKFVHSFGVEKTHEYLQEMHALPIFQVKGIVLQQAAAVVAPIAEENPVVRPPSVNM